MKRKEFVQFTWICFRILNPENSSECVCFVCTGSAFGPSLPSTSKGAVASSGKRMPTAGTAVKDSDGFLAPPPASTLLIRRTRTSSTGGSTYVVTPTTTDADTSPPLKRRFSSGDFGGKGEHEGLFSFTLFAS